jgi:hypothetical protein
MFSIEFMLSLIITAIAVWYGKKDAYPFSTKLDDYKIYLEYIRVNAAQPFYTKIYNPWYETLLVEVSDIDLIARTLAFLTIVFLVYIIVCMVSGFCRHGPSGRGSKLLSQDEQLQRLKNMLVFKNDNGEYEWYE